MAKKWIPGVRAGMVKRGTVGAFTRQATRAGMGVQRYAAVVLGDPSAHSKRTVRRARLARTFGEMGAKRSGRRLPPVFRVAKPARPAKRRPAKRRTRRVKRAA